jgi:hypothetical protein
MVGGFYHDNDTTVIHVYGSHGLSSSSNGVKLWRLKRLVLNQECTIRNKCVVRFWLRIGSNAGISTVRLGDRGLNNHQGIIGYKPKSEVKCCNHPGYYWYMNHFHLQQDTKTKTLSPKHIKSPDSSH